MSYNSILAMSASQSLIGRVAACAATQHNFDITKLTPTAWAMSNILRICSGDGWATVWGDATNDTSSTFNPDTGAREDVITDTMILTEVVALINIQFPVEH